MTNITQAFADYLFRKSEEISEKTVQKAEECFQDWMAVTTAGAAKNRERWTFYLSRIATGKAELIGTDRKADGKTAALINGFNAHCLELDDGQRFAMIHLGAPIISAIKAAADENTIREKQVLTGIIMGYEAACRIAIAMQPSHKNRGFHTAGTCGTIGAAVGTAFALGMDKEQQCRVITCAAGSAAGMLEMQEQNSEIKPYNTGRAAMDGLTAATMGFTNFEIPDDILGGERGFFRLFSDQFDLRKLTASENYFEIERIYVKPYASCRHSHSAVEAAIKLHQAMHPDEIKNVEVWTYKLGVKGHDHQQITSIASAKLSTPYAVAAGLLYGKADLTVFEPLDKRTVELAKVIIVKEDPKLTAESPKKRIAIVTVRMKDGTNLTERVDYAKGDPENPMTKEELAEKIKMLYDYATITKRNPEGKHYE